MAELSEVREPIWEIDAGRPCSIVYRPGDKVCILEPRFVFRVGYPLTWPMLRDEVQADPRILQTAELWGMPVGHDLVDGICRALTRLRHFGGNERSIYVWRSPNHIGEITTVDSKRTVMTGTYNAPHFSGGDYNGEREYEPGYLSPCRSRVLLRTAFGEIERCYVKKAI
jgi:hypothetical protein